MQIATLKNMGILAFIIAIVIVAPRAYAATITTTYSTAGTFSFTVPTTAYKSITVTVRGAGGGGGGRGDCGADATDGSAGNASSFNSTVVGNGGGGGLKGTPDDGSAGAGGSAGTASGGDTNTSGGGASGGGTSSGNCDAGGGGGSGGLAIKTYAFGALTGGSSITVVVGAGGTGGTGGNGSAAGNGSPGSVIVGVNEPPITFSGNVKFLGLLSVAGALSKGSGTFLIDHPLDPKNMLLYHSFVESPDVKNLYDGVAKLDANGQATINLPSYFEALNKDFRYQFFPLYQAMPDLYIKTEERGNRFTIAGGKPGGEVSWQITGIRHDAYILANPVIVEVLKTYATPVKREECLWEPLCE